MWPTRAQTRSNTDLFGLQNSSKNSMGKNQSELNLSYYNDKRREQAAYHKQPGSSLSLKPILKNLTRNNIRVKDAIYKTQGEVQHLMRQPRDE